MGIGMNHPGMNGNAFSEYVRQTRKSATDFDMKNFYAAWKDVYGAYFDWSTPWNQKVSVTQTVKKVEVLMISFWHKSGHGKKNMQLI